MRVLYQQSATVDKRLTEDDIPPARADTAIGAVFTPAIMIAIVVTTAATLYLHHQQMIGALVVSPATAWAFGEAFRWPCSLNFTCTQAKRFYGLYAAMVVVSAGVVLIPNLPLIKITVYVEAFNAFILPIVLAFLLVMANDRKILGDRVNSLLGNVIAIGVSIVCVALGVWVAALTFTGQAGV